MDETELKTRCVWPVGGGEMGKRIREHDWLATPLGRPETWPQRLKAAVDTVLGSPVPSLITWGTEHVILYNDAYAHLYGTSHPDLLGQPTVVGLPGFWDELRPRYERVLAGETFTLENLAATYPRFERPETFHFTAHYSPLRDEGGGVAGVLVQTFDITQQVRAEAGLQESEARYRIVAETASDVLVTIDEESSVLYLNPAAEEMFGYRLEEMLGQELTMLMPEYLRRVHAAGLKRYHDTGQKHISWEAVEVPGLHKDGHEIDLEISFGEYKQAGRHLFTAIIRDVTERKRAEAALNRELEDKVRARTRQVRELAGQLTLAEAKERSKLAQVLHDELQQQLYAVGFALQGLRSQLRDDAGVSTSFAEVKGLVDGAVAIARATTADLSPPVLRHEGLVEALAWLGGDMAARHGLRVHLDAPGAFPAPNEAVHVLLFSLVRELLFNVVKHAGVNEATVTVTADADWLTLAVSDLGKGFDPAALEAASTGLGLSSVRNRLELFDGKLELASALGEGTQVAIVMPIRLFTLT